jgi:nucleotide-binding universal stress UspA family protein
MTGDGPLILVGVDGSTTAWRAFAWACGHARRIGGQLVVIYVTSPTYWESMTPLGQATAWSEEAAASAAAQVAAEAAELANGPVTFEHRIGDPTRILLAAARQRSVDLIVVGASTQPAHRIAGSVAGRLIKCQQVPVVVVP